MPFISDADQRTLKDRFKRELKNNVNIRLFTQRTMGLTIPGRDCTHCDDTEALLEELANLSPKLDIEVKNFYTDTQDARDAGVERIPAIIMSTNGSNHVKFYGIPMGFEFSTIIEDIITISRGVSPLTMASRKKLKQVKEPVHIQVFVTPTCGYCPQVARLAHSFAMENENIIADVIEVQEFPILAQRYMISGVPKTVINNKVQFVGAVPESGFVDFVLKAVDIEPSDEEPSPLDIAPQVGPATKSTGS